MILGYSYRYFDDNLSDDPSASPQIFSHEQVHYDGETARVGDGREVKGRWVPLAEVRKAPDGRAYHPSIEGLLLEEVVEKMSKSRGNVVNPDDVIVEFGADSMRLYEMFIGPLDKDAPWSADGIQGVRRFLERVWRLLIAEDGDAETLRELVPGAGSVAQARLSAQTIHGVTQDLDAMRFNTAISKLMVYVRDIARNEPLPREAAETLVLLVAPLAPHLAEELWSCLGNAESLARASWPSADPSLLVDDSITLAVQVNGKRRDEIEVPADAAEDTVRALALASDRVQKHLEGREPRKVIVVPGRLVNIVG
jgi:leucyl-tRNA synthetase